MAEANPAPHAAGAKEAPAQEAGEIQQPLRLNRCYKRMRYGIIFVLV